MFKRSFVAALIALAAIAVPASAVEPTRQTVVQNNIVQDQGQACGFPVRWEIHLTAEITRFFDKDGALVRVQAQIRENNFITNLATGFTLVEGPDSFVQTTYIRDDGTIVVATGLAANVQSDPKLMDVGRVVLIPLGGGVFDLVFAAGPHAIREAADLGTLADALSAFCDVLS